MHDALEVAKVSSDCKDSGNKMSLVHLSASSTGDKSSMIVPVWISHRDQPRSERMIYALLDTQSDTSFILHSTADALEQKGTQVSLLLSTLGATRQRVDSSVISGLTVRGFKSQKRIALPSVYTGEIMPANRDHIPTPEKAKIWSHLAHIQKDLMPLADWLVKLVYLLVMIAQKLSSLGKLFGLSEMVPLHRRLT